MIRIFSRRGWLALLLCLLLVGCSTAPQPSAPYVSYSVEVSTLPSVEVSQVPDEVATLGETLVRDNVFYDAVAFSDRLLRTEVTAHDEAARTREHRVWMMDPYGETLGEYRFSAEEAYSVRTLTATEDGGFLFVLGFSDLQYGQGTWAGEGGYASRVIHCDSSGALLFDTEFPQVKGGALDFCIEAEGRYYFFGDVETPETDVTGIASPSDIALWILDGKGNLLQQKVIAGSDFENLLQVEQRDGNFVLSLWSQSTDGDFVGSSGGGYPVDWVFTLDKDLNILDGKEQSGRDFSDDRIGFSRGKALHVSDFNEDVPGTPTAYVDYGDYYLLVWEHITGEYEHTPPTISAIWHTWETVYSFYSREGELIYQAAVDSTPDYGRIMDEWD